MRYITVFFDLEGGYGGPPIGEDQFKSMLGIVLGILDEYQVKAVFNTCGKLAEDFPSSIQELCEAGHEIASHGYVHEEFLRCDIKELTEILRMVEKSVGNVTGKKISGIRSPGLSMNLFSLKKRDLKKEFYSLLEKRGYTWASNYCMWPIFRSTRTQHGLTTRTFALNVLHHLHFRGVRPSRINSLLEIPVLSPLDSTLLGLPPPTVKTPVPQLDRAFDILKRYFHASTKYFNVNFHPWIIGSANRPTLLKDILGYLSMQDTQFVLPRELLPETIGVDKTLSRDEAYSRSLY